MSDMLLPPDLTKITRRVLLHEGAQLLRIFVGLLQLALDPLKEARVAKNTDRKRGRADASLPAIVLDFGDDGFLCHGPDTGQLSRLSQGQLASRLQRPEGHAYAH